MTILGRFTKQPAEVESYSIEFADDLVNQDKISSATSEVVPEGLNLVSTTVIGTRVKVLVSGGTNKTTYKITVTAQTDDGRTLQDEFIIKIVEY